jgi:hypothetical protein
MEIDRQQYTSYVFGQIVVHAVGNVEHNDGAMFESEH